jgi:transglutaminase-like putative cysteine protease
VLLELSYHTRYTYDPPVGDGLTALRLRPTPRPGLIVHHASISATPGKITGSYIDGWGTQVDIVELSGRHGSATFEARALVETVFSEQVSEPTVDEHLLYTMDSERVRTAAVRQLGWHVATEGRSWQAVESTLQWIPQRFVYDVGATDACTPIEAFIAQGAGVCQDFAHVYLGMLRAWGWCARYVSGFFFTGDPASGAPVIEDEAMHAWVEVYRPGSGWIGLDPTSGRYADERYVPVGYGRDYDDVRPVRGVFRGATTQAQTARLVMHAGSQRQQQQ